MRTVISVLVAVFLGLLIAIAVRPLLVPPIPLPAPKVTLHPPPTVPSAARPPATAPRAVSPPSAPPSPARAPHPIVTPRATLHPATPTVSPRPAVRPSPTSRQRTASPSSTPLLIVQVAVVPSREEAARLGAALRAAGFDPYVVQAGAAFAVRLGAFRDRARAVRLARQAAAKGFPAAIIERR